MQGSPLIADVGVSQETGVSKAPVFLIFPGLFHSKQAANGKTPGRE